jgi:hypothetical protein
MPAHLVGARLVTYVLYLTDHLLSRLWYCQGLLATAQLLPPVEEGPWLLADLQDPALFIILLMALLILSDKGAIGRD